MISVCHYDEIKQTFSGQRKGGSLQSPCSEVGSSWESRMPQHAHPVVAQLPLIPSSQLGVGFTPPVNFAEILFRMDVKKPLSSFM